MNGSNVSAAAPGVTRNPNPNALVAVLAFAGITASVMMTLVVPLLTQLPEILNTSHSNASWVVTATLLAGAVATPVSGRLGDLYGKRRIMLVCAAFLVLGSVVCALASSLIPMVAGRALQGVGMGLVPLGISAMKGLVPAERLGSSIALMSASMGVGGALGLPAAAAVVEFADWRVMFWAAAALAAIVFALLLFVVPATPRQASGRFDPFGAVGLGVGLICLLLGISKGSDWGWASGTTVGLLVSAVVILLAWGWFELRTKDPLVDLRVTAQPVVLLTNLSSLAVGVGMYAFSLIAPQIRELPVETGYGLGQGTLAMGLWMLPGGLAMMAVSPLGARLSGLRGPKFTLVAGALVIAGGYLVSVAFMGSTWGLLVANCTVSGGVGLAYGAMPALIMGSVPVSETASANSFNTLMRSLGTTSAAALIGVVLANMTTEFGGYSLPSESGFQVGLIAAAIPSRVVKASGENALANELDLVA
jgi:predicted MFS family arabinose efflux permease